MIAITTKIPEMSVHVVIHSEKKEMKTTELFDGKTILFGLPGAFSPTCSQIQLPGFANQEKALRDKGYTNIICMSVNDPFVMHAWKEQVAPTANIIMLADGSGLFTKALGVELDLTTKNMGVRCTRFLLVAEKGIVTRMDVESNPSVCSVSGVSSLL